MYDKPQSCGQCPLSTRGKGYVISSGAPKWGVVVVGEMIEEEDSVQGGPVGGRRALVGSGGQFLNRLIERCPPIDGIPLRREDFLVTNILRCRPPNGEFTGSGFEFDAIRNCSPLLRGLLKEVNPKCILTLGNQPLRWFTGNWGIAGSKKKPAYRGYIFDSPYGPVVPTYHPEFLKKGNFNLSKIFQHDLLRAIWVAQNGAPKFKTNYLEDPPPEVFERWIEEWRRAGRPPLVFDIETPYSQDKDNPLSDEEGEDEEFVEDDPSYTIIRISFGWREGEAVSVPWLPPYNQLASLLLNEAPLVMGWNSDRFDIPRLRANGVSFGGIAIDLMDLWHFAEPALPMGLKYVANLFRPDVPYWKDQIHSRPAWYSCIDSDIPVTIYYSLRDRLEKEGRWDAFDRQFIQLRKVLDKLTLRGVGVDKAVRDEGVGYFEKKFKEKLKEVITKAPIEVCPKKVFKASEERLRKEGKWEEGRMVLMQVECKVPSKTWYGVSGEGELMAVVWKGRCRGEMEARQLASLELGDLGSIRFTVEKPKLKLPKRSKNVTGVELKSQPELSFT